MNTILFPAAKDRLQSANITPSVHRLAILQYLLDHRTHPAAEDIYLGLLQDIPTLSRTTVHNTLKRFSDEGIILSLSIEEKQLRYDGNVEPHAHFRCLRCGKIEDVVIQKGPVLEDAHLKVTDMQVLLKGFCADCR